MELLIETPHMVRRIVIPAGAGDTIGAAFAATGCSIYEAAFGIAKAPAVVTATPLSRQFD